MENMIGYILIIYLIFYFGAAFVLPTYRVWKKTGVNPVTFRGADTAHDYIGKLFKILGKSYTVIGILKPLNRPINYNNIDFDHAAIISLESGKQFNQNVAQIQQINVKASSIGMSAEEYRAELAVDSGWTGMEEVSSIGGLPTAHSRRDRS